MVKGRIPEFLLHSFLTGQFQQFFLNIRIKIDACFQLYIDLQSGRFQKIIHLCQCRDHGIGIFRMRLIGFEGFQLSYRIIFYLSLTVRYPVDDLIMDHHQFSVFAQLHIQLHAVCFLLCCQFKCFQCIFRCISGCSSVCPYFCIHRSASLRSHSFG